LTLVLKGEALEAYKNLDGKEICVTGKLIDYKGKPEIIVTDAKKLAVTEGK
jgi:DNA/RNA endonuclease YhcR with UshA esterase domain